jgi:hypothetical protein
MDPDESREYEYGWMYKNVPVKERERLLWHSGE